ncbi:hypothetical protein [Streptomyces sp. NRRL F-4474]|uniref:hypothetical protein n=1 Tax=Streptomyces sp. NRRL F-4474 TaxID=1463851 RepID=UPI00131CA3CC|nr:hypothetical protein [Streptomyces sp. NRRL F-4474]
MRRPGNPGSAGHPALPGPFPGHHRALHPDPARTPAQPNRIPRTTRTTRTTRTAEETHP